jgi:two-component sensor histidine kinase/tetratricopeptide (TPR) repeat protein
MFKSTLLFGLLLIGSSLSALRAPVISVQDSLKVVELIEVEKYQEALELVTGLTVKLKQEKQSDIPFSLWLSAERSYLLDRLGRDEEALQEAYASADRAEELSCHSAMAAAWLTIALVQEKSGMGDACQNQLKRVATLLKEEELPAAQSRYHVRAASYHRIFGNPDSVAWHAERAIRLGKASGFRRGITDGHMLMALATGDNETEAEFWHFEASLNNSRIIGSNDGVLFSILNMAKAKYDAGLYEESYELQQEAINFIEGVGEEEITSRSALATAYLKQAEALYAQERYQESIGYLRQGQEIERTRFHKLLDQKVAEVEATYNIKKASEELEEQKAILYTERRRVQVMWMVVIALLGMISSLVYLMVRLRRTKGELENKSRQLSVSNEELTGSLAQQKLLRGELHHRVKNNLQVIISLLNLQEIKTGDLLTKNSLRAMSERVYSIAAVHDLLDPHKDVVSLNMLEYFRKLCRHSAELWPANKQPRFQLNQLNMSVNLDTMVPLGMMISELLTNSRKYFGRLVHQPLIGIELRREKDLYELTYRDNGPGFPAGKMKGREGGLGKYLIRSMARQLEGSFTTANDEGAVIKIKFKIKNASEEGERLLSSDRSEQKRYHLEQMIPGIIKQGRQPVALP